MASGRRIPLSEPNLGGREWEYVKECLDTGWVSSAGAFVDRFERDIAGFCGARHAVACVNGSAALQVALHVAGVGPGDEVLVPTLTFIAPVNAVRSLGATPVFFDCDEHLCLDPEGVLAFLEEETRTVDGETVDRRTGAAVRAVLPVHVLGNAADLEPLLAECRERSIRVVEDAAEAVGTRYLEGASAGRHAGTVGDVGVLSFNGNKIITSGGGGMLLTDDEALAESARYLTTQAKDDAARYIHHQVGYNYRLTNVQAAMGVAQLEQLPGFLLHRRRLHELYAEGLSGVPGLTLVRPPARAENNHWLTAALVDPDAYGEDLDALISRLGACGIEARRIWHLNHLQRPYEGCRAWRISRAPSVLDRLVCLPSSSGLSEEDVSRAIEVLRRG